MRPRSVGGSLVEEDKLALAKELEVKAKVRGAGVSSRECCSQTVGQRWISVDRGACFEGS